ncbi:hypothetical protein FOL46_004759 [Perkinsus olseni]|uniref:Aspartyl/asparaginy/proline hydroxylase domain-containing protein n=2 Tax=Perkinsus olseni TaxID=32597 RepID=A0A7J6MSE5_PEROL|nr:hypothetical protein FOL46_004759 [Perkinsus olseni]
MPFKCIVALPMEILVGLISLCILLAKQPASTVVSLSAVDITDKLQRMILSAGCPLQHDITCWWDRGSQEGRSVRGYMDSLLEDALRDVSTEPELWAYTKSFDRLVNWTSIVAQDSAAHLQALPIMLAVSSLQHAARHPLCYQQPAVFQRGHCANIMYKMAIQKLLVAHLEWVAQEMLEDARDKAGLKWPSIHQTPTVWVEGLPEGSPWVDCERVELARHLVDNYEVIRDEVGRLDTTAASDEYGYLHASGKWEQLQLFRNGEYLDKSCSLMPETCRVLREGPFPTRPDLVDLWPVKNNEEAILLFASPGTHVPVHSGAANTQINVHLPLVGITGASIAVHPGGRRNWTEATAMCFDDSFAHEVWHEGDHLRIILVVRVMHPAATRDLLGRARSTTLHDPTEL